MAYRINIVCGNSSIYRSKPTPAGYTHDWELYIKGQNNASIHNYIDKIVFHLHESFPNPVRTFNKPPYVIRESGYAGFEIPIDVYLRNNSEPRKFHFKYDLSLAKFTSSSHSITHTEIINNPSEEFAKKLRKGGALPISNSESVTEKKKSKLDQMVGKPRLSGNEPKKHKHDQKTSDTFNDVFGTPIKTGKLVEKKPSDKKVQAQQSLFSDKPTKSEKTEKSDKSDKNLKTKHISQKDKKPEKVPEDTKLKKDPNREKDVSKERSKVSTSPEDMKSEVKSSTSSTKEPKRHSDSSRDKTKEKSKDPSKSSTDEKRKDRSDRKKDKKKPKDEREREKKDKHRDRERENERSKEGSKPSDKKPEKETLAEPKIAKDQIKSPKQDKPIAQTPAPPVTAPPTVPAPVVSNDSIEKIKEHKHTKSDKDKHRKEDKDKSRDSNEKERSRDFSVEKEKSKKHKKRDKKDRKDDSSKEKERKERKEKYREKSHKSAEPAPPLSQVAGFPDRLSSESAGSAEEETIVDKVEKVPNTPSKPDIVLRSPSPIQDGQTRMSPPTPRDPMNYEQQRRRTKDKSERKRERTEASYERKQDRKRARHESKDSSSERIPSKDLRGENSPLDESVSSSLSPMTMSSLITSKNSNTHVSNDAVLNIEPIDVDSDDAVPDSTDSTFDSTTSPAYFMQLQELQHKINALNDFNDLHRLMALITRTGHFEVTTQTVDFDLCHFDKKTIEALQDFFDNLS
ncbi:hypothetical protein TKK_0010570 [Trichogramma kaykai]|uniref:YEATS domain-containing protein n=1 Tax=Trichogramma kaykai TaxID=54128 RepID=A0ABD2WVA0_9HYME